MRRSAAIALAVFAVAIAALVVVRSSSALHPPYPRARAVTAARSDPGVAAFLAAHRWRTARVIALDERDWRVTFWDGAHVVADAAVDPAGHVVAVEFHASGVKPPGSRVLWTPAVLVLLALVFVFAVAGSPLRSLRNLDALVVGGGFTSAALLFEARLTGPQMYVADAALAYVAVRLARVALGAHAAVAEPLHARLLRRTDRTRVLLIAALALTAAGVVTTLTSPAPSDVALAGLQGATLLNHGVIPYGHIGGGVVHGDTYPLLSYVLYMPVAAIRPVHDAFDSLDGALWMNALFLVGGALVVAGGGRRAHALAWAAFPPLLLAASTGGNDVPAAALVAGALVAYAREPLGSGLLTLAAWVKVVPGLALLPWLAALRARSRRTATVTVLAVSAASVAAILLVGGAGALSSAWHAMRFQFVRGSWYSIWQLTGTRALQPVFQAATLAFAAFIAAELTRAGSPSLRSAAAGGGAVVALIEIGGNSWSYQYVVWLLPFILLALFPPVPLRSRPPAQPAP